MAENDDPTPGPGKPTAGPEPATAEPTVEQTAVTANAAPPAPAQPRFTDRLWNFRAMVAVALAALLLGGGAGAAIAAVSHDDGPDRRGFLRFDGPNGPGMPGMPGGPGMHRLDPEQRKEFREGLKDMRKEFRDRLRKELDELDEQDDSPTPPTPSS
jgi:hypothetical protein